MCSYWLGLLGSTLLSYTDDSSGCNALNSYACGSGGGDYTERHPNDGPPVRC